MKRVLSAVLGCAVGLCGVCAGAAAQTVRASAMVTSGRGATVTVKGAVEVTRNAHGTVKAIVLRCAPNESVNVALDAEGQKLGELDRTVVKAIGTLRNDTFCIQYWFVAALPEDKVNGAY